MYYNTFIADVIKTLTQEYPGAVYLNKNMVAMYMWNKQQGKPISASQEYAMLCINIDHSVYTYEQVLETYGPRETVALYTTIAKWKNKEKLLKNDT